MEAPERLTEFCGLVTSKELSGSPGGTDVEEIKIVMERRCLSSLPSCMNQTNNVAPLVLGNPS
ncbi:hypothetical protein QJS10_CPA09g02018 [Acorus calamus]|uniref:Uncharacterized protein n=1 Tax=Acorus calamus TaxID=4465 RepID=A0AAV9E4Z3_ACOCL|nr:hypothetical protein QJS10_CPA09g02018 [Acorus calamus]